MPYVATPHLMVAALYDSWQLSHTVQGYDGIIKTDPPPYTPSQAAFAVGYAGQTRTNISRLTRSSVVARACYSHHDSEHARFWTAKTADGASQASALEALLQGKPRTWSIDGCTGVDCGRCTVVR